MALLPSLADTPGTLREYETIYILKPNTQNDQVADVNQRVRGVIEERGGKVLTVDNWGKRRLAYEVEKQLKGIYLYWQYLASPEIVAEFERNMRMLDSVIRYMTVKLDADVSPDARPSDVDDEAYERAATTAADEEELMMRGSGEGEEGAQAGGDHAAAKPETEEAKAETPAETPADTKAEAPAETKAEAPADTKAEAPAETKAETPADAASPQAPADTSESKE